MNKTNKQTKKESEYLNATPFHIICEYKWLPLPQTLIKADTYINPGVGKFSFGSVEGRLVVGKLREGLKSTFGLCGMGKGDPDGDCVR
jgi:hypothetical protein